MQMRLMNFNLLSWTKYDARRELILHIFATIMPEIYYNKNFIKNGMNQGSQQIDRRINNVTKIEIERSINGPRKVFDWY